MESHRNNLWWNLSGQWAEIHSYHNSCQLDFIVISIAHLLLTFQFCCHHLCYHNIIVTIIMLMCFHQGAEFPQAVVGFDPDMDPQYHQSCGVLITDDNWLSIIRIPVVAKLDGASDGQQIRVASVWSSVHYASLEITSSLVSTVTVRQPSATSEVYLPCTINCTVQTKDNDIDSLVQDCNNFSALAIDLVFVMKKIGNKRMCITRWIPLL